MNVFIDNPLPITRQQLNEAYQQGYDQYPIDNPPASSEYAFYFYNKTLTAINIKVYNSSNVVIYDHNLAASDAFTFKPSLFVGAYYFEIAVPVISGNWFKNQFSYGSGEPFFIVKNPPLSVFQSASGDWFDGVVRGLSYLEY